MNCNFETRKRPSSFRLSQKISDLKHTKQDVANDELNLKSDYCENNHLLIEHKKESSNKSSFKVNENFFFQSCTNLAKALLGKLLVRKLPSGELLKGRIVETESYLGIEDQASHSYKGKKTERNEAMFLSPGTAYVYSIYGMYYCFNISSLGEGSAVLIRAVEPIEGLSVMKQMRSKRNKKVLKDKDLCNGPSKLCQAFNIEKKQLNKVNLTSSLDLWIENDLNVHDFEVICCKRIGIDSYGEEWANKPLRFYIRDCKSVSIRNKMAENEQN